MYFFGIVLLNQITASIIGLYFLRNSSYVYKLLLLQLIVAICCEVYGYFITSVYKLPNLWLFNIYMPAEILLLNLAGTALVNNKIIKLIIAIVVCIIIIAWGISVAKYTIHVLANQAYLYGCIGLVILYLYILFNQVMQGKKAILTNPVFWVCISILIYFGCYIPYKGIENSLLLEDPNMARKLFYINLCLNIVRYSLIAIAFYLYGSQARRGYVRQ